MLPNALARKEVSTAAEISNTFEYRFERGDKTSCRMPRRHPSRKAIGRSIGRALKANGPTDAEANPWTRMSIHTGNLFFLFMISSNRWMASSTPITS